VEPEGISDMYDKILVTLKTLSVIVFFCVLSYEVVDLARFSKTIIADTQRQSLQQITDLRKDTFTLLDGTTNKLNARIGSIQMGLLSRVDINASRIDNHLTVAIADVNGHLNKLDTIVDVYTKLPEKINNQLTSLGLISSKAGASL
jgi:Mg2+ and Co2+ transporter CorA